MAICAATLRRQIDVLDGYYQWQMPSNLLLQYVHRSLSVGIYLPVILLMVGRVVCVRAILFEPSF